MTAAMHDKYVIINRETMAFIGVAEGLKKADMIAELAPPMATCIVMPLDRKSHFASFGVLELMLLERNCTGQPNTPGAIHDFANLIVSCYKHAMALPVDTRTESELESALKHLPIPDAPFKIPKAPPVLVKMSQEELANYKPGQHDYHKPPSAPRAPSAPGAAPSKGATGRVWGIADRVRAEMGGVSVTKEMRTKIIAACEAEGINAGTAATQFGKWKATQS